MNLKKMCVGMLALATAVVASAQNAEQQLPPPEQQQALVSMLELPLDSAVRKGVLPNGLTYYIRHNEWPEDRAFFYIAQNVGSMQEEESQRGLAHFLEHMCFNGTTHFPGNRIKTFLEENGVKFGENLNAYTSFDQTVYNIDNVKTDNPAVLDSCLMILHDWSHDLLLEDAEIDKERGVINEEWRMRRSATQRLYEASLPEIYPGSKYAERMPIGTMDVVMNFKPDTLRAYYKKWYRPDQQAIIVVGDVDVDQMEARIKAVFADIKAVENPVPRMDYPVPDNATPLVAIHADKEMPTSQIMLFRKHDCVPKPLCNTLIKLEQDYENTAISSMFSARISEILQKSNPPFIAAQAGDESFFVSKTKDAFTGIAVFKDNGQKEALTALYREMLRMGRYGFTVTEYERFKQDYLAQLEDAYSKRDKVESSNYVNECVDNFLDNEPMAGIEYEYQAMKAMIPEVPLGDINARVKAYMAETDSNLVIVMFAPEKDSVVLPTKQELLDVLHAVEAENIETYKEEVSNEPLIQGTLKGAKVKCTTDGDYDSKVLTLKNGIKIHVKKTDFTPNSISMRAVSWGGTSLYSNQDYLNVSNASLVSVGGLGNFSQTDLTKRLAGITASADVSIGDRTESVSGSCVTKDLETMLQLTYLTFTSPRKDQEAYDAYMQRLRQSLQNQELNPMSALQDSIASTFYDNNVRAHKLKVEDLNKFDYDQMMKVYKERFADGDDFEFFFVGDIDLATATPLFEKYLGSLPTLKGEENYKDIDFRMADGERTNVFEKEQQTPNSISLYVYHCHTPFTQETNLHASMLGQIMSARYIETVREDQGGAYGIPTQGSTSDWPSAKAQIIIQLPTAPEKRAALEPIIQKGIDDICTENPTDEELQKVKEYMLRAHQEDLKQNSYWMNALINKVRYNREYVNNYEAVVNATTPDMIRELANQIFRSGNRLQVTMTSPLTTENAEK